MFKEKGKQDALNRELSKAVVTERFDAVVSAVDRGAVIDHQTPEGHTALTYAAFRGTSMVNLDGRRVLAVSMLLDRADKRPNINRETRLMGGHTALTLASREQNRLHAQCDARTHHFNSSADRAEVQKLCTEPAETCGCGAMALILHRTSRSFALLRHWPPRRYRGAAGSRR